jgi:hypothetical protein
MVGSAVRIDAVEDQSHGGDLCGEGLGAELGDLGPGAGTFALVAFGDGDQLVFGEDLEVAAEVAVGELQYPLDVREVAAARFGQDG